MALELAETKDASRPRVPRQTEGHPRDYPLRDCRTPARTTTVDKWLPPTGWRAYPFRRARPARRLLRPRVLATALQDASAQHEIAADSARDGIADFRLDVP